jgi:hypothetical protein
MKIHLNAMFVLAATAQSSLSPVEEEVFTNIIEETEYALDSVQAMAFEDSEVGEAFRRHPYFAKTQKLFENRPTVDLGNFKETINQLSKFVLKMTLGLPKQPDRIRIEREHLGDLYLSLIKMLRRTLEIDKEREDRTRDHAYHLSLFAMLKRTIDRSLMFLNRLGLRDPHPAALSAMQEIADLLPRLQIPSCDFAQQLEIRDLKPEEWSLGTLNIMAHRLQSLTKAIRDLFETLEELEPDLDALLWGECLKIQIHFYEPFLQEIEDILAPPFMSADEFLTYWDRLYKEFPDLTAPPL